MLKKRYFSNLIIQQKKQGQKLLHQYKSVCGPIKPLKINSTHTQNLEGNHFPQMSARPHDLDPVEKSQQMGMSTLALALTPEQIMSTS